jgi:hypothetical protein
MKKIETRSHLRAAYALKDIAKYTHPHQFYVPKAEETERLYSLEEKRSNIMKECAKEYSKVCSIPEGEYWTRAIPQMLFDILDNYDTTAALLACEAVLLSAGYEVSRPEFENPDGETKAA